MSKKPPGQRPERQGPMHRLEVGKPYDPARGWWPEGADYNFRSDGHELRLFLLTRFGTALSFDCSYHWQRRAEVTGDRTLPPASLETSPALRALVAIILVEATSGVVLVLRAVTFSPEFTRAIHEAIADQAAGPYDRAEYQRWADGTTGRSSTNRLSKRCTMQCQGGS